MSKGVKRQSPGADDAKNVLKPAELSEEDAIKLNAASRAISRADLFIGTLEGLLHGETYLQSPQRGSRTSCLAPCISNAGRLPRPLKIFGLLR